MFKSWFEEGWGFKICWNCKFSLWIIAEIEFWAGFRSLNLVFLALGKESPNFLREIANLDHDSKCYALNFWTAIISSLAQIRAFLRKDFGELSDWSKEKETRRENLSIFADFTWNQFWQIENPKIYHFNNFSGCNFWVCWIFQGQNSLKTQIQLILTCQNVNSETSRKSCQNWLDFTFLKSLQKFVKATVTQFSSIFTKNFSKPLIFFFRFNPKYNTERIEESRNIKQ